MRKVVIGSMVAILSLAPTNTVLAHSEADHSDERSTLHAIIQKTVEATLGHSKTATEDAINQTEKTRAELEALKDRVKSQREQIEERKSALKEEIQAKQQEPKEKLEGRRLAQCQNRQDKINDLVSKGVSASKDRLASVQGVEDSVKAFYRKYSLSSSAYEQAVQIVDQKEAAAIAALDVASLQRFECDEVNGIDPSGTIRSSNETIRTALSEYKGAVKELIVVTKSVYSDKVAAKEAKR